MLVIAVDTILLHTIARNTGEVSINLPGLSNRTAWLTSTNGIPRLSIQRSTSNHEIWLFGSLLYVLLLSLIGNLTGKWINKGDSVSA
ncbi:MAG TPA: hypothetical protein VLA72_01135 [Anaerolineales bacterium]|nr:hypothetical protein [Anaerolineales bacterium]